MKLAGIMATRNYSRVSGAFPVLAAMTDITIVLDDGSDQPFYYREQATEYIYLKRSGPWNQGANLTMLLYRAFVHGCDWVFLLDDDLLPSRVLYENVRSLIDPNMDLVYVGCRELWGDAEHYRVDGLWGRKETPVLIRNWFFDEGIAVPAPVRLHKFPLPTHRERRWTTAPPAFLVYHLAMIRPEDREARIAKYRREDPNHEFQGNYSYLADENGLVRAHVPPEDHTMLHQWMRC